MATSWISCSACSRSDSSQDTVKVEPKLLNKENVQPLQTAAQCEAVKAPEEQRQREEARQRKGEAIAAAAAADAARQHEEAEKRKAAAEKAHREGRAHSEFDLAARHATAQNAAAERASAAREQAAARAAAAVATAAQEERRRQAVAEEQARLDTHHKVNAWCKDHGFKDMDTSKKTYMGGVKFPLHTAVKHSNQEIIAMMLLLGVQKDARDSKSQTPSQLAAKLNKRGSHEQVLTMLL